VFRNLNKEQRVSINAAQYETLMRPLNATRIAKRPQGGKQLSYLESWDVRAHLIRVFGFGNFDAQMLDYHHVATREYTTGEKDMVEVIYAARMQLTLRDEDGFTLGTYAEAAVGSTSGPASMLGEHHDNALKTAASDALKRCAINLGSQFGLGLYDGGSTREVIRGTVVVPKGYKKPDKKGTEEQEKNLEASVGSSEAQETSA
jgi:recombination DNA repair RAD52 pathway protein